MQKGQLIPNGIDKNHKIQLESPLKKGFTKFYVVPKMNSESRAVAWMI